MNNTQNLNSLAKALNVDIKNINQLRTNLKLYRLEELKKIVLQEGEFKGCYDYEQQDVIVSEILKSLSNSELNKLIEIFKEENYMETNAESYLFLFGILESFINDVLMISGNTYGPYIEIDKYHVTFVKNSKVGGICICCEDHYEIKSENSNKSFVFKNAVEIVLAGWKVD